MAKLYMDPDKVAEKVASLRELAEKAAAARTAIDTFSAEEHDPMHSVGIDELLATVCTAIEAVQHRAGNINSCRQTIVDLNSNGVAPADSSGGVTLDVPAEASVTSSTTLATWAQGATDAHDLASIDPDAVSPGVLPSGRTYDELIASIQAGKTNHHYANGLVTTIGPENLTQVPLDVQKMYLYTAPGQSGGTPDSGPMSTPHNIGETLSQLLGEVLATASTTWTEEKSATVAEQIVGSVDQQGKRDRVAALNAMIGRHDQDGDGVNDLDFSRTFLVNMAEGLEKIPRENVKPSPDQRSRSHAVNTLDGYSFDPLAGVLDAMGNNTGAAIDYLAPKGKGVSRLEKLSKRDWDTGGFAGFVGAMAAATIHRANDSDASTAARADTLAEHGISYLADNTEESLYNDAAKPRIGMLPANCAPEVTSALTGSTTAPAGTQDRLPMAAPGDIRALIYRIADNEDATATMGAGLAEATRAASEGDVAEHSGDRATQIREVNRSHMLGAQAVGALAGMADVKAGEIQEDEEAKADAKTASAQTAVSVFDTVATAGLSAVGGPPGGLAGKTAISVAKTLATPVIVDAVVPDAKEVDSTAPVDAAPAYWASAIQVAANSETAPGGEGLISQQVLKDNADDYDDWIVKGDDGRYRIDLSEADSSTYEEVTEWTRLIESGPDAEVISSLGEGVGFRDDYTAGKNHGIDIANGLA